LTRPNWILLLLKAMSDRKSTKTRYIVRFNSSRAYRAFLASAKTADALYRPLPVIHAVVCSLANPGKLRGIGAITGIEPDGKIAAVHLVEQQQGDAPVLPWGVSRIKAPAVWTKATGRRVKIAIIDTGVDFQHPDLRHAIAGGINLVHRQLPPYDDNGHGTHIAGTIAAEADKSGVVGVAPDATLYAVKAFDFNGTAYVSDIVKGIDWSVRNRMDVINMSFGMKIRSQSLEEAVKNANRAGTIIVASSGNDGRQGIDFPARYPEVISVGATNRRRAVAAFSNQSRKTDIYAPGDRILSTWTRGRYSELSGTSMATSHVTGVVALMLSAKPGLRADDIRIYLQKSAVPIKSAGPLAAHTGEVDAEQAMRLLTKTRAKSKSKPSAVSANPSVRTRRARPFKRAARR
jgi:subtilisin